MTEQSAAAPAHSKARITGVVYLLYFVTAICAQALQSHVAVYYALNVVSYIFYIAVTLLFYRLFAPVNKGLSLLAAIFSLLGCANDVLGLFNRAPYKINSLVFFAPFCLLIGYLIFSSTFMPRIFGVLMMVAGVGWLIFLSPLGAYLSTPLKIIGFVAELCLMLWLVVKGVNEPRWSELATKSAK